MLAGLSACYHAQINSWVKYKGGVYLPDSQYVVFRNVKFHRKAKGLTAFPDGGISKQLYSNTSLYRVNLKTKKLNCLHDFDETGEKSFFSGTHLSYQDSVLLYSSYKTVYSGGQAKDIGLGIYRLNLRNNFRQKVSDKGRRAVLSTDAQTIAFLYKGHVFVYDINTKTQTAIGFPNNIEPAYIKYFGDTLYLFSMDGNWCYDSEKESFEPDSIEYEKNYGQAPIPYQALKAIPDSVWGAYLDDNKLIVPK